MAKNPCDDCYYYARFGSGEGRYLYMTDLQQLPPAGWCL